MYLAVAEKQGVDWSRLSGTLQNDILKEYIAQKEYIFPPRPSMRLVTDVIEYCDRNTFRASTRFRSAVITSAKPDPPRCRSSPSRCATASSTWIGRSSAGFRWTAFAPRLSFFFNSHNDFFEEIAKFRAARKIWAETMRDRYGANDERSWKLRTHAQTAGCSLTWQQPYNNIVRTTLQALAAVLGGTQSLHTNSLDEAYALPSEHAVTIALRTQQVIAYESGIPDVPDPLGGSYFVENLTAEMEKRAKDYIRRIDEMGGMIPAIERGFPQTEIANASYEYQHAIETGEQKIVGVNAFVEAKRAADRAAPDRRVGAAVTSWRNWPSSSRERDNQKVRKTLDALRRAAEGSENTMPYHSGRRARLRHGRRNLRRFPQRFRQLHRDQRSLNAHGGQAAGCYSGDGGMDSWSGWSTSGQKMFDWFAKNWE